MHCKRIRPLDGPNDFRLYRISEQVEPFNRFTTPNYVSPVLFEFIELHANVCFENADTCLRLYNPIQLTSG